MLICFLSLPWDWTFSISWNQARNRLLSVSKDCVLQHVRLLSVSLSGIPKMNKVRSILLLSCRGSFVSFSEVSGWSQQESLVFPSTLQPLKHKFSILHLPLENGQTLIISWRRIQLKWASLESINPKGVRRTPGQSGFCFLCWRVTDTPQASKYVVASRHTGMAFCLEPWHKTWSDPKYHL